MKALQIHLQPELAPDLDAYSEAKRLQNVIEAFGLTGPVEITDGDDDGPYINVWFATADVAAAWSRLRQEWRPDGSLARCSIVICEGEDGWSDYKLLHHFDPSELLDEAE